MCLSKVGVPALGYFQRWSDANAENTAYSQRGPHLPLRKGSACSSSVRTTKSKDGITGGVGPARVCHLLLARRGQEGPARARRGREGCGEERERVDLRFVWGRLLFCVFAFAFCWTLLQLPRVPFFPHARRDASAAGNSLTTLLFSHSAAAVFQKFAFFFKSKILSLPNIFFFELQRQKR